jgi:choice-of-anchor B domain-containing protein
MQLLAQFPFFDQMDGGGGANDVWGWEDPQTGDEFAIVGRQGATSFFNITDPTDPVNLGRLLSHTGSSTWRDIKVYQDHAFIVSDGNGPHGMQVFDLTQLRNQTTSKTWTETAHYDGFRNAHNIAINEDTGYAYVTGSNRGGLFMVNIQDPTNPRQGRDFSGPYVHDTQVVTYNGPDVQHVGREIAFNASVSQMNIADVTNKTNPFFLSTSGYPQSAYAHQGSLSEDHRYFYMDDELDEQSYGFNTRTHVWDVSDLDNPVYTGFHEHETRSTDHNLYVHNGLIYEANYTRGIRVLEVVDAANAELREVAYLDTHPPSNSIGFKGAWSVYPFFDSGTIIVSDRERGLFIARLNIMDVDFNDDQIVDVMDIDELIMAIAGGSTFATFDLNQDGVVDVEDRDAWLAEAGNINLGLERSYLLGDANLDGAVDGTDFVAWNKHKFTFSAAWSNGDFTADGVVDGLDFALWNMSKFTQSDSGAPAAQLDAVPEPSTMVMASLIVFLGFLGGRRPL